MDRRSLVLASTRGCQSVSFSRQRFDRSLRCFQVADAVYRRISQSRGPADLLVALLKSGIAQVVKLLLLIDNFVVSP